MKPDAIFEHPSVKNNEKYTAFRKQIVNDIRKIDICNKCPRRLNNELTLIG